MRASALVLALLAFPSLPWQPHLPVWAERLLYNPRERTERAREAYGNGDAKQAAREADRALRLAPDEPRVQFNDGTAQLAAGNEKKAIERLEQAARKADSSLAPSAWYNLGNARLAAGDASGAVAAYRETLLRQPDHRSAKFNLELARRKERDSKVPPQGQRPGQFGQNKSSQAPAPGGQKGEPEPQDRGAPKPGEEGPPSNQPGQPSPTPGQPPGAGGRLRNFRDQPDLNAKEAASLLNTVENFERQQRRREAAKRARERAATDQDW